MINFRKYYDFSYFRVLIVGFFIGICTAFMVWGAYLYFLPPPVISSEQSTHPVLGTSIAKESSHVLFVSEPQDEVLLDTDVVTVIGQTSPKTVVTVVNGEDYKIIQSDAGGGFRTSISLIEGINQLVVSSFNNQGEEESLSRIVLYSKEHDDL